MRFTLRALFMIIGLSACLVTSELRSADDPREDIPLEELPQHVVASMQVRDNALASLPASADVPAYLIEDALRWTPGQTVRVAFLGGTTALHKDIADATKAITDACNIKLDFGLDATSQTYRTWSENDTDYKAEIRVSFDQGGYFSLVGTDSSNPVIGAPNKPVGGRPNQRSLNLGGFAVSRPIGWRQTTRHEFCHAVGFHHEHQSPIGGCDSEFRWQNDMGYIPTTDTNGKYITDANNKRPGIYTYLAGFPNFWERQKVDHNLRQLPSAGLHTGTHFDQASIMLYRFPQLFYRNDPSPCAPSSQSEDLSAGDIDGLRYLYPSETSAIRTIAERQKKFYESVLKQPDRLQKSLKQTFEKRFDSIR